MTAQTQQTAADIEAELAALADEGRIDNIKNGNRDFNAEAREADADPTRGPRVAEEVRAEATLYRRRCERRQARVEALEAAAQALKDADVSETLEELSAQHGEALKATEKALAGVDFATLDAFEEQVDAFLAAAQQVRNHAVEAASVAKRGKAPAPGLAAVRSAQVDALHDRLNRLAARIAAPDMQSRRDLSMFDVHRERLD